jgi:predicted DNA-binding transcriptional regulator YafY
LDVYFAGSLGIYDGADDIRIRIRFSSRVARFVKEKRWHASQQLWPQRDGSLIAEFQLSSTVEVKRWVLSFGRDAVVLEPVPLCEEIAEEAAVVLAAYKPTIDTAAGNGREQVIKDRDKSERIRH